jgi:hypothetical protein
VHGFVALVCLAIVLLLIAMLWLFSAVGSP